MAPSLTGRFSRRSRRALGVLALGASAALAGPLPGCGPEAAPESAGRSQPSAPGGEHHQDPASEAPRAPVGPPPALRLVWLADGQLAVENVGAEAASVARAVLLEGAAASRPPLSRTLRLGLECSPSGSAPAANPDTETAQEATDGASGGGAARAGSPSTAECLVLVPGAALTLPGWPSQRGLCRCPPCLEPELDQVTLRIAACGGDHALSLTAPER